MKLPRLSIEHITVIVLLVVHLLPVWGFKYFPTQDGASHVYNAYVVKEYHNPENYRLREVYERNATVFPNWTSHALLLVLLYLFPPMICEKIVLTLCIGLLPLSLLYFLKGVAKRNIVFGLVGFLYAYNYLLHMGFYNFVLSMSLFFFTLGYWWRIKDRLRLAHLVVIYALLMATYLTHYHSYALLLLSLSLFSVFTSGYDVLRQMWGSHVRVRLRDGLAHLKPALTFLGALIPAYFILFSYYFYLTSEHGGHREHKGVAWLIDYLFSMKSLVSFRDEHVLIGQLLLLFFAFTAVVTIVMRVRDAARPGAQRWTRLVMPTDGFLIMAGFTTLLYFMLPWAGYSGGWINDRFHIYIFLFLLPCFTLPRHRYVNYGTATVLILLSLWHLGYNVHTYTLLNRDIAAALALPEMVEHDTILTSEPSEWGGVSDSLGFEPKYVEPFGHIECWLAVHKGIAYLDNYEATTDHFPIRYKRRELPADYAIIWRTEYDTAPDWEETHDLLGTTDYNRLYYRKPTPPDPMIWSGGTQITFDMLADAEHAGTQRTPIYAHTDYTAGRYGWLTRSEREGFENATATLPIYRSGVWGAEDAVFRVALPNGTYQVTCYFSGHAEEPLEMNLIANGERQIQRLRLPAGHRTVERRYTLTVSDEHLTQVIYTRGKGDYRRWGWSGFTVRALAADRQHEAPIERTE